MRRFGSGLLVLALCLGTAWPAASASRWIGSWTTASVPSEATATLPGAPSGEVTLRQVVRLTAGGPRLRLRVSNQFGTAPLRIDGAHVALSAAPAGSAIAAGTDRAVTFDGGQAGVTVPPGATWLSDPVDLPTQGLARVAVSLHLPQPPARITAHRAARTTAYVAAGDQLAAPELPGAATWLQWAQLAGVDVEETARNAGAVVTLGDSITDGTGAGVDVYERWPDVLAERLQADPRTRGVAVLNAGIGGNRLLLDGLGPNALARFDRDVINQAGVKYVILLEGVNDLGTLTRDQPATPEAHAALVARMIASYDQMIRRARERGIKVYGATVMPFGGSGYYHPDAANEQDRQAINAWIRTPGRFDAVIDFDKLTADPAHPNKLSPAFDSGDGLHPSLAGYKAMADAVPLALFSH